MPTCRAFHCPRRSYPLNFNAVDFCEVPIQYGFSLHLVCFSAFLFWPVSFSLPLSFNSVCQVTSRASFGWRVVQTEGHCFSQTPFTRLSKTPAAAAREDLKPARGAPCTSSPGESSFLLFNWVSIAAHAFKYINKTCKLFVWTYFKLSIYVCI